MTSDEDDADESDATKILADPSDRFEELLDRVRRLEHKQRSTGRVKFSLGPGMEFGVSFYTTIR